MYNKSVLDNKIRVVSEYIPSNTVSVGVWVDVGSRDEPSVSNGSAHFVEHMLFKGTPSRNASEIAKALDSLGGMSNAFTSKESTCLYGSTLTSSVETLVSILADLLQNSLFDEKEFESERQVVLQEISMAEDTPEDQVHDLLAATVWQGHSLANPVLGSSETVAKISPQDLLDFVRHFYTADRILIASAGDIEHGAFVEIVKERFSNCSQADKKTRRQSRSKPKNNSAQNLVQNKSLEQAHALFSLYSYPINHPDRYALALLNIILGGNMSSRLFQELREKKGLAYSVYSFIDAMTDAGTLSIYAGVGPQSIHEASEAIHGIISDLQRNISQDEVDRARDYARAGMYLASESMEARMTRLAKNELYLGRYYSLAEIDKALANVTLNDVFSVAGDVLSGPITSVVLGPVDTN